MTRKAAAQISLVVAGAMAVLGGFDSAREIYYRASLAKDLKPILNDLTVAGVIVRCGPPKGQMSSLAFRELSYQLSGTTIRFTRTGLADTDWTFTSFREWFGRSKSRKDPRQVLALMPCLDPNTPPARNVENAPELEKRVHHRVDE